MRINSESSSKVVFFCTVLFTVYFIFFAVDEKAMANDEMVNISTGEWAPWAGEKIPKNGFVLHVVREIFENAGYKVNYKFVPWKRAIIILEKGNVDASAYWYKDNKRDSFAYHSEPVTNEKLVFFYKKTNPFKEWNSYEDLKGLKIGLARGNTYPDELQKLIDDKVLSADVADKDLFSFRKLVHGRIDVLPAAEVVGNEILNKEFSAAIQATIDYSTKPLTVTTGHILFSKKGARAKEYLEVFNNGLKQIKEDGTYDKYFDKLLQGEYSK